MQMVRSCTQNAGEQTSHTIDPMERRRQQKKKKAEGYLEEYYLARNEVEQPEGGGGYIAGRGQICVEKLSG